MEIPLSADAAYGTWKPLDEGAAREVEWGMPMLPSRSRMANNGDATMPREGNEESKQEAVEITQEERDYQVALALAASLNRGQRVTRAAAAAEALGPDAAANLSEKEDDEQEETRKGSKNAARKYNNTRKSVGKATIKRNGASAGIRKGSATAVKKSMGKAAKTGGGKRGRFILKEGSDNALSSYTTGGEGELAYKKAAGAQSSAAPKSKSVIQQPAPRDQEPASRGNRYQLILPAVQTPLPRTPPNFGKRTLTSTFDAPVTFNAPVTPATYQYSRRGSQKTPTPIIPAAQMSEQDGGGKRKKGNPSIQANEPTRYQGVNQFRALQNRRMVGGVNMTDMVSAPSTSYGDGNMGSHQSSMQVGTQAPSFAPQPTPMVRPLLPRLSLMNLVHPAEYDTGYERQAEN